MRFILFSALFVCFSHLWGSWTSLGMSDLYTCRDTRSANRGHNYSWECLNDYLFTITCVLNTSSENQPRELAHYLEICDDRCTSVARSWVCVIRGGFTDVDSFTISVYSSIHGNSTLETDYMPVRHIRPVPPSSPSVLWEGDQAVFRWLSGYVDKEPFNKRLQYKLSIWANDKVWDFAAAHAALTVPTSWFAPNTSYTARVRSAPNQQYYRGVWSHWGPALHWTTAPKVDDAPDVPDAPDAPSPRFWLALLALFVLVLCGVLFHRWKRCVLIPSPVPHIGAIKRSAMAPQIVADLLQREDSLKLDNMIQDPAPRPHNIGPDETTRGSHTDVTFPPPSPSMLQYATDSKISWTEVVTASEQGGLPCSEGYCTLAHAQ